MKFNMKKQIKIWGMMLVAAFALTNCTKENIQAPEVSEGTPFEIVASTVDTKTVNDGFSTDWVAGDQINLFHAITESTTYVSDGAFKITEDNLAASKFTGTLDGEFDPEEEYDWYAIYPYSSYIKTPAAQTSGYSYIGGRSDQAQSQVGVNNMTHIAGSNYPIYGKAEAVPASDLPQLQMNHASALIEVKVTNGNEEDLNVTAISFKAPVSLVGTFYLNISDGISYTDGQYVSNIASLSVSDAVIKSGESASFYLAVKPFTATAGQELELTVNTQSKTVNLTQAQTFSAGKIKTLNFTYDKVETPGPADAVTAMLDLTAAANRVAYSTEQQVWMQNGITLTNDKNASTTDVGNYIPARFYKSSDVTIEAPGNIYEIQINCAGLESKYVEPWSSIAGASLTGTIVTISLDGSAQSVTYNMSAQARANSVTVVYAGGGEANTPEIVVVEKNKTISAAGGVLTFAYTLNNLEGQTLNCSSDSEWLTAAVAEGNVNVTVAANDGFEREGQITLTCGEARAVVLKVTQDASENAEIQKLTVAEFAALEDGTAIYELSGTITGIYQAYNSSFNNISFYLKDDSSVEAITIYRMSCEGIDHNKVAIGNVITVQGAKGSYNGAAQMVAGCVCVSIVEATPAPVISYADNTVTITAVSGASIYYTLDGSVPSTSSTKYTAAFAISATATVQAIAVEENKPQSSVTSLDCFYVDPNGNAPVPSSTACYVLDTSSNNGTNNGYATSCDVTCSNITWNVTGNATMDPWRIGGKSLDGVDRYVYTKTPYSAALSKIEFVSGTVGITWNSLELQYSTNSDFSNAKSIKVTSVAADKAIAFMPADGFPANCYFRFAINVTNTTTSNKYMQLKEVRFYGYE